MIIVEINSEYELKEQLEGTSYNDFSIFGLEAIMNYLDECYTTYTFEPCGFGSEFVEYSDAADSTLDLDDLINDYGYLLDDEDDEDDEDDTETWERVAQAIEDNGRNTVLWIQSAAVNGIVVVQ